MARDEVDASLRGGLSDRPNDRPSIEAVRIAHLRNAAPDRELPIGSRREDANLVEPRVGDDEFIAVRSIATNRLQGIDRLAQVDLRSKLGDVRGRLEAAIESPPVSPEPLRGPGDGQIELSITVEVPRREVARVEPGGDAGRLAECAAPLPRENHNGGIEDRRRGDVELPISRQVGDQDIPQRLRAVVEVDRPAEFPAPPFM